MKKLIYFIILAACLGSCTGAYDSIKKFAPEEIIYPGRFDTIIGYIGYERVELDLLKAGKLPSSEINLGKAQKTVVEYDDQTIVFDSVCSSVSITGLTQPRLYRFSVYTTDDFGNKSVPQEIALTPFTASDAMNIAVAAPRVTASPWTVALTWDGSLSSVLLNYYSLTYQWTDKDGNVITGTCQENPTISMNNLDPGTNVSLDIHYRVVPLVTRDGDSIPTPILDTITVDHTFSLYMPTDEDYRQSLNSRAILSQLCDMSGNIQITWANVSDYTMQYTNVWYFNGTDTTRVQVANTDNVTILPGSKVGEPIFISSNYKPVGVDGVYVDSEPKTYTYSSLDYVRTQWLTTFTTPAPASDGGGNPLWQAELDGDFGTFLSLAKAGKSVNGSTTPAGGVLYFVIDLQQSIDIDYFRIRHRDNTNGLRPWSLQIFGTNFYQGAVNSYSNVGGSTIDDPTNWEPIGGIIQLAPPQPMETDNIQLPRGHYRYIKVQYLSWDTANNSAVQIAELYFGISKNPIINN